MVRNGELSGDALVNFLLWIALLILMGFIGWATFKRLTG